MNDIGTLGGTNSEGRGINDQGHVTGGSEIAPNGPDHAFAYDGMLHDLGTLGGPTSVGNAINGSGKIAGTSTTVGSSRRAFLYDGLMHDLGTLGGSYSEGYGINDSGWVVGQSNTATSESHAFLYDGTMHDLGTLGGTNSSASAINASGQVTGVSDIVGDTFSHAFFYDGVSMQDLGTLPGHTGSFGRGINANGHVVGFSHDQFVYSPFLYTPTLGMVDLNSLIDASSGWLLFDALAINDGGQIIGYGAGIGDESHALLLTLVPEPSTSLLAASIILSSLPWQWRRRLIRC